MAIDGHMCSMRLKGKVQQMTFMRQVWGQL